ncbi:MAG: DNA replication/repair protein RecF [bacterium]
MKVVWLLLLQFRNHGRLEARFEPGVNAVVGPNGAGKTNVLEALDMAVTGRSHRARREVEVVQFGADWALVRAALQGAGREHRLEVRVDRTGLKHLRADGVPTSRSGFLGRAVTLWSGPEDTQVVAGPAAERRQLLDGLLCQLSPSYYDTLLRYHRVVRHRNRLLRAQAPPQVLEVWDEQLVDLGTRVVERRSKLVDRMRGPAAEWAERLGCGVVGVRYLPGCPPDPQMARERLARLRREEYRRGVSLVGPHRDELEIRLDAADARTFASRGQQRGVVLALRLAEREVVREELGEDPVLLLDDVVADLDRERTRRLMRALEGGPQVVATATDRLEFPCDHVVALGSEVAC